MNLSEIAATTPERRIRPHDVTALRKKLKLTQERLARLLEVSSRTVARWESDESEPEPFVARKLRGIERVAQKLERSSDPEKIVKWLELPESELGHYAPVDLLGSAWATNELLNRLDQWLQGE